MQIFNIDIKNSPSNLYDMERISRCMLLSEKNRLKINMCSILFDVWSTYTKA